MGFDAYVSGGFPGAGPSILIKENAAIFGHFNRIPRTVSDFLGILKSSWTVITRTWRFGQPPDTVIIGTGLRFSADSFCSGSFGFDENNSFS